MPGTGHLSGSNDRKCSPPMSNQNETSTLPSPPFVAPALAQMTSSSDQPPSIFARATNFFAAASKTPAAASTGIFRGLANRVAAATPTASGAATPLPPNWQTKSAVWRWITAGSGASLLSQRRVRNCVDGGDDTAPVTISPPKAKKGGGVTAVTVRTNANPRIDVKLIDSDSGESSRAGGNSVCSKSTQVERGDFAMGNTREEEREHLRETNDDDADMKEHEMAEKKLAQAIHAAFKSFCSAHVIVEYVKTESIGASLPTLCTTASFDSDDVTVHDMLSMLIDCARFSGAALPLAEVSDLIADAREYDSRSHEITVGEAEYPCQSARMLLLLHAMLCKIDACDATVVVGTAVDALCEKWIKTVWQSNDKGSSRREDMLLLFANYLRGKLSFLTDHASVYDGTFSTATLTRRTAIEACDCESRALNDKLKRQLFSTETLSRLLSLLTTLQEIFSVSKVVSTVKEEPSADSPQSLIESDCTHPPLLDAASEELIQYILAIEVFFVCRAVENITRSGICATDLELKGATVRDALDTLQDCVSPKSSDPLSLAIPTRIHRKTLLEEALLLVENGVHRLDVSAMISAQGTKCVLTVAQELGSVAKSAAPNTADFLADDLRPQIANHEAAGSTILWSPKDRQLDCTFHSITSLHSAFGREIRDRQG